MRRHESQGFALEEALSCNVPLLVWNVKSMNQEYASNYNDISATTIPYWDDRCGEYFYQKDEFEITFLKFIQKLDNYKPREYIVENLSIAKCANNFLNLLDNYDKYYNKVKNVYNIVKMYYQEAGFFSCCSVRLHEIIQYYNRYRELPQIVDSSNQFILYKQPNNDADIVFDYFENYNNVNELIQYSNPINYHENYQFSNYQNIDYNQINPFIKKYFTPSKNIQNIVQNIENKYNIQSYSDICVLFYRGNDKITETVLANYTNILERQN